MPSRTGPGRNGTGTSAIDEATTVMCAMRIESLALGDAGVDGRQRLGEPARAAVDLRCQRAGKTGQS